MWRVADGSMTSRRSAREIPFAPRRSRRTGGSSRRSEAGRSRGCSTSPAAGSSLPSTRAATSRAPRSLPADGASSRPAEIKTARVWALPGGRLVRELRGHRGQVTSGVLLAGRRASRHDEHRWHWPRLGDRVRSADHAPGRPRRTTSAVPPGVVTASPSSRGALTGQRVSGGRAPAAPASCSRVPARSWTQASFDTAGDRVLTTSADGRARIWRSRVDAELRTIARVPTPISAAAFTLDGSIAAVAGASGVWVLRSADGGRLATLPSRGVTSARARSQRVARRRREWKPHRNDPHRDGGDRREDRGGRQNEGVGVRAGRRPLGGRYRRGGDRASGRRAAAASPTCNRLVDMW